MKDEAHGIRLLLLWKTGKYSVMLWKFTSNILKCTLKSNPRDGYRLCGLIK